MRCQKLLHSIGVVVMNENNIVAKILYRFAIDAFEHISELTDSKYFRQRHARPLDLIVPRCTYFK